MEPATALVTLGVVLLVLGAGYAAVLLMGIRRFGDEWSWMIWAGALALLLAWGLWQTAEFPGGSVVVRAYFISTFLGIPLAGATWGVRRARSRTPQSSAISHVGKGLLMFLAAVPLGLILAVIPDAMRLFW